MSHECDICGDEFDSERGLHVHQSQKHGDENNANTSKSKDGITLTTRQFGAAALAFGLLLGLAFGGLGGATAAGMIQDSTQAAPGGNTSDTGNTDDADNDDAPTDAGSQDSDAPSTVPVSEIDLEGEPVLGEEDASVTLVIYEEFECPFCKRFEGTLQQIKSKYVDSGQVKIVWKDFPLTSRHPWAQPAAETAECVYRQDNDAFWSVKSKIYENQDTLSRSNVEDQIISWASEEGVKDSAVKSCLENGNPGDEVRSDLKEGQGFDTVIQTPRGDRPFVSGTPGSVVFAQGDEEGEPVVGAQPVEAFQQIIDSKLNK